jgi:AcrR family transcriptional regulator
MGGEVSPIVFARKRDATATRAALLAAARTHFARDAYDSVSLRGIAADAKVDVSLVGRYFGSKEELFAAVLDSCPPPDDLFQGDPKDFGERVSRMLVDDPITDDKFDVILVMLRSATHPAASEAIRQSGEARFYGPFAQWLGGRNTEERVRLAGSIIKGVVIDRRIASDFGLNAKALERYRTRLARTLQTAIEE